MEDSFEIDTIKETNEEHSPDYDENYDARRQGKKSVASKSSKVSNQRNAV
mgnify:CR=1 FL=1|jgi:hypothetical protein